MRTGGKDRNRETTCLIKKNKMCTEWVTWLSYIPSFKHSFIFCWCLDPKPSLVRGPNLSPQGCLFCQGDKAWRWSCHSSMGKHPKGAPKSRQWGPRDRENLSGVRGEREGSGKASGRKVVVFEPRLVLWGIRKETEGILDRR